MTHPSPFALERLSVADLPAEEVGAVQRHVDDCPTCRAYLAEVARDGAARLAAVPPAEFMDRLRARDADVVPLSRARRPRQRWVGLGAGVAALAAAAAVVLWLRTPAPRHGTAFKGAGVTVHLKRGAEVRALEAGDRIRAGDALRVVLTLPRGDRVAIYFVDRDGRVDRFLEPTALAAGRHEVPGSAVVEAPCKDLQLVVVPGPADPAATLARLRTGPPPGAITEALRCE
jgi:hypothetical protein